jgi:hypothetical protein
MVFVQCNAIGDFIAIATLIADLIAALKEAGGSADKYRSFIRELAAMRVALEAVSKVAERCTDAKLREAIVEEVKDCCITVEEAAKCVAKFSPLGQDMPKPNGNFVRLSRLWYKVEWKVMKQSSIDELKVRFVESQRRLTQYIVILNKCVYAPVEFAHSLTVFSENTASLSNALASRIEVLASTMTVSGTAVTRTLGNNAVFLGNSISRLIEEHSVVRQQLALLRDWSTQVKPGALDSDTAVLLAMLVLGIAMQHYRLALLYAMVFSIIRAVWKQNKTLPSTLGFSAVNTVTLIDVLGERILLPLQLCESFDVRSR